MKRNRIWNIAAVAALTAGVLVAGSAVAGDYGAKKSAKASATKDGKEKAGKSLYSVAKEAGDFQTLLAAVDAAGLKSALDKEGPYTVFAPTDEAFAKLPEGTVESLLKDKAALKNILLYHVVAGTVPSKDAVALAGKEVKMANGEKAKIQAGDKKKGVGLMIDSANIVAVDVSANNGVIHVIDTVILPPANSAD
jgi:transforming growth factor-beta-induced protein